MPSNHNIKGVYCKYYLDIYEQCVYTLHLADGPVQPACMLIANDLAFLSLLPASVYNMLFLTFYLILAVAVPTGSTKLVSATQIFHQVDEVGLDHVWKLLLEKNVAVGGEYDMIHVFGLLWFPQHLYSISHSS